MDGLGEDTSSPSYFSVMFDPGKNCKPHVVYFYRTALDFKDNTHLEIGMQLQVDNHHAWRNGSAPGIALDDLLGIGPIVGFVWVDVDPRLLAQIRSGKAVELKLYADKDHETSGDVYTLRGSSKAMDKAERFCLTGYGERYLF